MPRHERTRTAQPLRSIRLTVSACCMGLSLGMAAGTAMADGAAGASATPAIPAIAQDVGRFAAPASTPPPPWQLIRLDERIPPTQYTVKRWDGVTGIEARADGSMALMARPLTVNLAQTPVLCWRWRVDDVLQKADMTQKSGDDYAARVYVALKLPPQALGFGLRTKLALARSIYGDHVPDAALNYVWDNRHPPGTILPNAYTDRTQMIVMKSGRQQAGRWVNERRDVMADALQLFGKFEHQAASLAVASDTDNTKEQARAGFADLHFVARDQACRFDASLTS